MTESHLKKVSSMSRTWSSALRLSMEWRMSRLLYNSLALENKYSEIEASMMMVSFCAGLACSIGGYSLRNMSIVQMPKFAVIRA